MDALAYIMAYYRWVFALIIKRKGQGKDYD